MRVSVIIPVYNEEEYLPRLLESLKNQTFRDFEVIVADAGSKDNTVKIARDYGAKIVKGGVPAVGRNNGAKAAKGEFLFFFDADVKFNRTFLDKALRELDERYLDLSTCEFRPLSNLLMDRVIHEFANMFIKVNQFMDPHAAGCAIFVTSRLFRRVGGFNEKLKLAEDHDFVKRASEFRNFRVLESVHVLLSVRRFRKEGRLNYIGKVLQVTWHRTFKGNIVHDIVEYEFGTFNKNDRTRLEKRLREIEKNINKINMDFNRMVKKHIKNKSLPSEIRNMAGQYKQKYLEAQDSLLDFFKGGL